MTLLTKYPDPPSRVQDTTSRGWGLVWVSDFGSWACKAHYSELGLRVWDFETLRFGSRANLKPQAQSQRP